MNTLKNFSTGAVAALFCATAVQADWARIFDGEDSAVTSDESALEAEGWVFQDYDFAGFADCEGVIDCTGVREIITAPYDGNGNVVSIRATDPAVTGAANGRSASAFQFPDGVEVPSGEIATIYLRFAFEGYQVAHHFGFTSVTEPVSGPNTPTHNYSDLGPTTQVSLHQATTQETLAVYETYKNSWWTSVTQDATKILEPGVWYELWYQLDNATVAEGGGFFELYIRGGAWGDGEPVHLFNWVIADTSFTDWGFRDKEDAALTRFLNIANGGTPDAAMGQTQDAIYFDDMYVTVGEHVLTVPPIRTGGGGGIDWPDEEGESTVVPAFGTVWYVPGDNWYWTSNYGFVWTGHYEQSGYFYNYCPSDTVTGWYYYWGKGGNVHYLWSPKFSGMAGGDSQQGWCAMTDGSQGFFYLYRNTTYLGANFATGDLYPRE
jgi:hypothetical protein